MKHITKTSKQSRLEKENKNTDNYCPECDMPALGIRVVKDGFFKLEELREFTCFKCGCEWNTGWKRV